MMSSSDSSSSPEAGSQSEEVTLASVGMTAALKESKRESKESRPSKRGSKTTGGRKSKRLSKTSGQTSGGPSTKSPIKTSKTLQFGPDSVVDIPEDDPDRVSGEEAPRSSVSGAKGLHRISTLNLDGFQAWEQERIEKGILNTILF